MPRQHDGGIHDDAGKFVFPIFIQIIGGCPQSNSSEDLDVQLYRLIRFRNPTYAKEEGYGRDPWERQASQSLELEEASLWQDGDQAIPFSTIIHMRIKECRGSLER